MSKLPLIYWTLQRRNLSIYFLWVFTVLTGVCVHSRQIVLQYLHLWLHCRLYWSSAVERFWTYIGDMYFPTDDCCHVDSLIPEFYREYISMVCDTNWPQFPCAIVCSFDVANLQITAMLCVQFIQNNSLSNVKRECLVCWQITMLITSTFCVEVYYMNSNSFC